MPQSINELERDIEQTRARLDSTIDQLQSRLSASGIVDEVLGTVRRTQFSYIIDDALDAIRRNPVPVLLVTAGLGLLFHRMNERSRTETSRPLDPAHDGAPSRRPRRARGSDPDIAPAQPASDTTPPRRAQDARA